MRISPNTCPGAVKDGNDLEARERVAYGAPTAGITMQLTSTTAQHSMEHAMSAYHQPCPPRRGPDHDFPGAQRSSSSSATRLRRAVHQDGPRHGMPEADKPEDFLTVLAQIAGGVRRGGSEDERLRDPKDECMALAINAREIHGRPVPANPRCRMRSAGVFARAYR